MLFGLAILLQKGYDRIVPIVYLMKILYVYYIHTLQEEFSWEEYVKYRILLPDCEIQNIGLYFLLVVLADACVDVGYYCKVQSLILFLYRINSATSRGNK